MCFHFLGNACITALLADNKWILYKMDKWLHYVQYNTIDYKVLRLNMLIKQVSKVVDSAAEDLDEAWFN